MEYMFMPLRRYADFSGRSRRMEFWMWQLFKFLVVIAFWIVMVALVGSAAMSGDPSALMAVGGVALILYLLMMVFWLAILIPDIAVAVRRLHDTNRTGWWILAPIVPYIVAWVAMLGGASTGSQSGMAAGGLIGVIALLAFFAMLITLLVFYFLEGTRGPNKYGPDPKSPAPDRVFA